MTVGEYIEELKKLDQDKGIWVFYDFPYAAFDPMPSSTASKYEADEYNKDGIDVKEGDYVINAG